jgi:hypothetical protein
MMRLRTVVITTALLALALGSGCTTNRTTTTSVQDYGDYFTLSAVKGDVLILTAKANTAENTALLNTAARAKAAWFGKTMGFNSFQIVDESSAEFNSINVSPFGARLNSESVTGVLNEVKSLGGLLTSNDGEKWYDYQFDTPEQHTTSWGGAPLLAENGYRYRLVVRFFRGNEFTKLRGVYDIDEVLHAQRLYSRRGTYNPSWIDPVNRR